MKNPESIIEKKPDREKSPSSGSEPMSKAESGIGVKNPDREKSPSSGSEPMSRVGSESVLKNGIIVVNKPQEFTSFDVVAVMRRLCGQRKIGHTGTLDPMATGVLPLLLGNATRAQDILPDSDKEYVAQFRLGLRTDTLDIWGSVVEECDVSSGAEDIKALIPKYTGEISQIPPMYSAVKKDGVRLYDLARQGVEVEREARKVTVSELKLLDYDDETHSGQLKVACSKGTYIRTLIDDIGRDLGCGAVMTSLVRTKACGFTLEDSISIDGIRELSKEGECPENTVQLLRSCESLFDVYRRIEVSEKQALRFSNGNPLDVEKTSVRKSACHGEILRVCDRNGNFLGLGKISSETGLIKIFKLFPSGS